MGRDFSSPLAPSLTDCLSLLLRFGVETGLTYPVDFLPLVVARWVGLASSSEAKPTALSPLPGAAPASGGARPPPRTMWERDEEGVWSE